MNAQELKQKMEITEIEGWLDLIEQYELRYPYDLDLYCIKAIYRYRMGNAEEAVRLLKEAERKNPYFIDALYNLAVLFQEQGDFFQALEYYTKLQLLEFKDEYEQAILALTQKILQAKDEMVDGEEKDQYEEQLKNLERRFQTRFERAVIHPWAFSMPNRFGIQLRTDPRYYQAYYCRTGFLQERNSNLFSRLELRPIHDIGNVVSVFQPGDYFLPIAKEERGEILFRLSKERFTMEQMADQFLGYRMQEPVILKSCNTDNLIVGKPIPLIKDGQKKSLILTLFIDGLSQAILDEFGLSACMPNTFRFFSDGIHCTNCFSTGEWTYPSMAAYFSGQYTTEHKMFHPHMDYHLPKEIKMLTEFIQEAGYHTAKIDGDWRTNPDYGYIRGMDRVLTATYGESMHIKEVVYEAMDHLLAMKETNQYLYLNFGELHDIADEYKLPMDVRMRMDLKDLQNKKEEGITSVKQQFDASKKRRYLEQMKYVDRYLGILFDFLEREFAGEEILVTLFSDHGQGFLVPDGSPFLSEERSKVPLLIKGFSKEWTICEEYISIVDYLPILGKIANIPVDLEQRASQLPVFFGGAQQRKYVLSESLYPKDTYKIALRNADYIFYLESKDTVGMDARVDLSEYRYTLKMISGREIDEDEIVQECLAYVMDHMKYFRKYESETI